METIARKYFVVRIVRCNGCGLIFTRPIYSTWLSENFYDRFYSAEGSTTELPSEKKLVSLLNTSFAGNDKNASAQLAAIAQVVGKKGRLLELGSSWGYFLVQARTFGFDVIGIEIGSRRRDFAKSRLGLRMLESIEDVASHERFDVIYTSHVLEHFTDISRIFKKLSAILADNGRIFIEVPNIDVEEAGPACLSMVGAVHPVGYNVSWFKTNLPNHGLEVVAFYDKWSEVPQRPVDRVTTGTIILIAERSGLRENKDTKSLS